MGVKEMLESRWSKAGQISGTGDFKFKSTVDATMVLIRGDGLALTAKSSIDNATDVSSFLGRKFDMLVSTGAKSGDIGPEDTLNFVIKVGDEKSPDDDTISLITQDLPKTGRGISFPDGLTGLKLTFPVKTTPSGFIFGETSSNGHSYSCLIALWISKAPWAG